MPLLQYFSAPVRVPHAIRRVSVPAGERCKGLIGLTWSQQSKKPKTDRGSWRPCVDLEASRLTRRGTQWLRRCKSLHVGVRQVSVAVIEVRMHVGTHRSENAVTRPTCERNAGFPFCSRRIDQEGRLALKTAPAVSQQALKTGDSHCRARSMGANRAWLIANR